MIERVVAAVSKMSPAAWWLVVLAIGGALVFEGWVLLLRQPLNAYLELSATRASLRALDEMTRTQEEALRRATVKKQELAARLSAELQSAGSEEQLTVSLMRRLDQAAARDGIVLTSLKPASRRPVLAFEEVSFEVGAQGKYLPLCQWLLNFQQSVGGFATVTDFTMRSADEGRKVSLNLRLALYRPSAGAGADK